MKKSIIFLALAATGLAFTSCEDDKEPVYHVPTEFVLNTPPMAESVYILHSGDIVEFTCSQPDYGYSAVTNYAVDIASEEKFVDATDETEANYFTVTPVNSTSAKLEIKAEDIAKAICERNGIKAYVDYPEGGLPVQAAYVRVRAWLTGVPTSTITSNTVALGGIEVFNPYPAVPGQIYFVGDPNGWLEPVPGNVDAFEDWKLVETGVGTNIFVGSFEIPAGTKYFRFYQTLSKDGYGEDGKLPSIGSNAADGTNTEVDITDEPLEVIAVPGKGAWYTSDSWAGGAVTFTVDLSDLKNIKVTMALGAVVKEDYVYLVGSQTDWKEPNEANESVYDDWKLVDVGETGIYTATFTIPAGDLYFRVYPGLTGWGNTPYASSPKDNVDMAVGSTLPCVEGEGCWVLKSEGQEFTFTLDTNAGTMTVSEPELPEAYVYLVGSQAGWKEPNEANESVYDDWKLVDKGLTGVYTATFDIPAGDVYFRVYPALTGWGATPYAAAEKGDVNVNIAFASPLAYTQGEGNWLFKADGGPVTFTLDTNAKTMSIAK